MYVDTPVVNGKTYYYALVAYDRGDDGNIKVPPSETQHEIKQDPVTGILTFDVNTGMAVPGPMATNYVHPVLDKWLGENAERVKGIATGDVKVQILDDILVKENANYDIDFVTGNDGSIVYNVKNRNEVEDIFIGRDTLFSPLTHSNLVPGSVKVKEFNTTTYISDADLVIDYKNGSVKGTRSGVIKLETNYVATYQFYPVYNSVLLKGEDGNAVFDGMRIFVEDQATQINSVKSTWKNVKNTNIVYSASRSTSTGQRNFRGDFEVRWHRTDVDGNGSWLYPGDTVVQGTQRVVCPFEIWNIRDNRRADFYIGQVPPLNGRWDPGEPITIYYPDRVPGTTVPSYQVLFNRRYDTVITYRDTVINGRDTTVIISNVRDITILPTEGDEFLVFSDKNFIEGDEYSFTTRAGYVKNETDGKVLDNIFVVPNPYVMFGEGELPDPDVSRRGERRLEFRNLPNKCTIRVYTINGELVKQIDKDNLDSYAIWNLLSFEGQSVAYGIYIYHVDAPGLGAKIGRLAIIK
jgi:hypothetical protein